MRNLFILIFFISTYSCKSQKQHLSEEIPRLNQRDTAINLSNTRTLYFTNYKEIIKGDSLYTETFILNNAKDTIIKTPSDGLYTSGWYSLSPNKEFLIIDAISLGYVYISETDSVLHDRYDCNLINLTNGRYTYVEGLNEICGGDSLWNKNNQLINPSYDNNTVIFDPEKNSGDD